jgi:hypothetical protein
MRLLATLAALAPAAAAAEPEVGDIKHGFYTAQVAEGCAEVRIGEGIRWTWDAGCDGSIEREGSRVEADGDTVSVGGLSLELKHVGPKSFTGEYSYGMGLITPKVTFHRR